MPKYYVQSGSFRGVVIRRNAKEAARWAVKFVMNEPQVFGHPEPAIDVGLFRLGNFIGVSERGFSRKDRERVPTSQAVLEWMIASRADAQS
jgi:hypothetical protein